MEVVSRCGGQHVESSFEEAVAMVLGYHAALIEKGLIKDEQ